MIVSCEFVIPVIFTSKNLRICQQNFYFLWFCKQALSYCFNVHWNEQKRNSLIKFLNFLNAIIYEPDTF